MHYIVRVVFPKGYPQICLRRLSLQSHLPIGPAYVVLLPWNDLLWSNGSHEADVSCQCKSAPPNYQRTTNSNRPPIEIDSSAVISWPLLLSVWYVFVGGWHPLPVPGRYTSSMDPMSKDVYVNIYIYIYWFIYCIPGTCECPLFWGKQKRFHPPKEGPFTPIRTGVIKGFQVGDDILYPSTWGL